MRVRAIAPWFGGKRTMAPEIVTELGTHRAYWDCFCGSMAVLLAKPVSSQETAIDKHGFLTNLARVLQAEESAVALYARAARTICSTVLYHDSHEWLCRRGEIEGGSADEDAAYHYFIVSWIGRNGTAGCTRTNYQPALRYTPGGGAGAVRFVSAVESIPAWHHRLRNVIVIHGDAFDHICRIDDVDGVAIYADPPYLHATRGGGGGSQYLHDFTEAGDVYSLFGEKDDHARLAEALRRFKRARIVVSYYDHPRISQLYPGWTIRRVYRQKNLHVQNKRGMGHCEAPEVLLLNGPSYAK